MLLGYQLRWLVEERIACDGADEEMRAVMVMVDMAWL